MRKLNKLIAILLTFVLGIGMFHVELAASGWPSSQQGGERAYDSSVFAAVSSMSQTAGEILITSGSAGMVYGLHIGTVTLPGGVGNYIIFQDSIGVEGGDVLTEIVFTTTTNGMNTGIVQFNPPFRFYRGLTAEMGSCAARAPAWCYTVLYDRIH